jgi:methyltransferase
VPPASLPYIVFVAATTLLALLERALAWRNETRLLGEGAEEVAPWIFRLMVPAYSLVFPAAVLEHLLEGRSPGRAMALTMVLLFGASKGLKAWAILHLRGAWTMRVVLPRALRVVTTGPYRLVRHPNYVAVIGEILSLPLAGGAWLTALAAAILFAPLLYFRIRSEEAALLARPEYAVAMAGRRRFMPGGGRG